LKNAGFPRLKNFLVKAKKSADKYRIRIQNSSSKENKKSRREWRGRRTDRRCRRNF